MFYQIDNVLNAAELSHIQTALNQAAWEQGAHTAGKQAKTVKNNEQLSHDDPVAKSLVKVVLAALSGNNDFKSIAVPLRAMTPCFNRYCGGSNFYGKHIDNAVRAAPHNGELVRTDMSMTIFINEPNSYQGGALRLHLGNTSYDFKLPAGSALLYDAAYVHEVLPVTKGERLACFFWVQSMVQDAAQRRTLHELDVALTRLREAHGETDETVQLMGVYHNLLRMWSLV